MPLQLGNGDHGYNNRAACGASDTAAVEAEEDGAVKLDAEMAIAKKAAWNKPVDEKAEKEEAEARAAIEKAKAPLAKKTRKGKTATAKAGGDTAAPIITAAPPWERGRKSGRARENRRRCKLRRISTCRHGRHRIRQSDRNASKMHPT